MPNMKQWQEFTQIFHNYFLDVDRRVIPRTFPKSFSFDKDPEYWESYSKSMKYVIQLNLERAKIFEVDDRTKRAMLMTNIPKNKEILKNMHLPYPSIFLDMEVTPEDDELDNEKVVGILISERSVVKDDFFFMVFFLNYTKEGIQVNQFKISFTDVAKIMQYALHTSKTQDILKRLIVNTILFITDPEVEHIVRERSEKNEQRRNKEGKQSLPTSYKIKLTGTIKEYFDKYGDKFDGAGYSHKFDVRGNWRHFKNDRFKRIKDLVKIGQGGKEGYVIRVKDGINYPAKWIPPYKKGEGIYVNKNYSLEKPLAQNELDLESILPLTKPLRELRENGQV